MNQGRRSAKRVPGCSAYFNHKWKPTEEQLKLFDEWKQNCIDHLVSCADGNNISQLLTALRDRAGEVLPLQKMGLGSVYLFLYEMANFIEIRRKMLPTGAIELYVFVRESAVPDQSRHLRNMVLKQRRPWPRDESGRPIRRIRETTEYVPVPPLQLLEEHFRRKPTIDVGTKGSDSEAIMAETSQGKETMELPSPAIQFDLDFKVCRRHMVDYILPYAASFPMEAPKSLHEMPKSPLVSGCKVITLSVEKFMAGYMNHP